MFVYCVIIWLFDLILHVKAATSVSAISFTTASLLWTYHCVVGENYARDLIKTNDREILNVCALNFIDDLRLCFHTAYLLSPQFHANRLTRVLLAHDEIQFLCCARKYLLEEENILAEGTTRYKSN